MNIRTTGIALTLTICLMASNLPAQDADSIGESGQANATQVQFGLNPQKPLVERVGETPESVLDIFREASMSPEKYSLSDADRQQIMVAISTMPPLHQQVLSHRLRSLSFVNNMPNTALTSTVNPNEPFRLFDITVRAAILKQSAAEWVTEKESSCFIREGSAVQLRADVGNITAIQYVLLHEATHVVDATLDITPSLRPTPDGVPEVSTTPFTKDVWEDARIPVSQFQDAGLMSIRFRRGGKMTDAPKMKAIYEALGRTPFVSLYGSSARTEDLAEYATVYHLTQKLKQPFRISIYDGGSLIHVHEPVASETTRSRFEVMQQFYQLTDETEHGNK